MNLNKQSKKSKQRQRLFEISPLCHYCQGEMRYMDKVPMDNPPTNVATVEHLFDRFDSRRVDGQASPVVLACWQCNHDRSVTRSVEHYDIHIRRSHFSPRKARPVMKKFEAMDLEYMLR